MTQILAWKCDHSGRLFETKQEYIKHLKKHGRINIIKRKKKKYLSEALKIVKSAKDTKDLENKTVEAINHYYSLWKIKGKIKIQYYKIRYYKECSNSHNCPRGGVTNWYRHSDKPTSYPGLKGNIKITISNRYQDAINTKRLSMDFDSCCLELNCLLKILGVKIGSGGSSDGVNYNYSITLFESDFRELGEFKEVIIKNILE